MKTLIHPVTGQTFKLGRKRSPAHILARPRLHFGDYILPAMPPAPPYGPLGRMNAIADVVEQCYGNDSCGDCTIAGKAHLIGTFTGNANPPATIFTTEQMLSEYSRLSGYVIGNDATDTGLDLITVLEDWKTKPGLLGAQHQIKAYLSVDPTNVEHVKLAIWLLFNGYMGLELPQGWITPMPSANGFVFQIAGDPDEDDGHCIVAIDYNDQGVIILTWGMWGIMTWPALAKYLTAAAGGEFHVVITQEIISHATQKAPNGFDFAQLLADSAALAA